MAARAGVEPTTLRLRIITSTNAPPCPTNITTLHLHTYSCLVAYSEYMQCERSSLLSMQVGCVSDEEAELNRNATITFCRRFLPIFMRHTFPGIFSNCRVLKISMRSSDYNYRGNSSIPFTFNAMGMI